MSEIINKRVINENLEGRVSYVMEVLQCVHSNFYHLQKMAGPALVRGITCTTSLQIVHAERNAKQPVYPAVHFHLHNLLPLQSGKNPSIQHCITISVF